MITFVVRRLVLAVLVVVAATTLAFAVLRLAPGDPFTATVEQVGGSDAARATLRARYGLDQPIATQYLTYLALVARGDLGPSAVEPRTAARIIRDALPNTLLLMGTSIALAFIGGVVIGAWQASGAGRVGDRLTSRLGLVLYSVPEFWLALVALLIFAYHLRWFPLGGVASPLAWMLPPGAQLLDRLHHLALPALVLAAVNAAVVARFQREALIDVLPEPWLRAARARGLSERRTIGRHALRAALPPIATLFGLAFPALLGGTVLVERVFAWPGMGYVTINAIAQRDYFVVTAAVIVGAIMTAVGSLIADLLHAALDPRVRVA